MANAPGQGRPLKATTIDEKNRTNSVLSKLPPDPAYLPAAATLAWSNLRKLLNEAGITSNLDKNAVELYCTSYARWLEAERQLQKHGLLIKSPNGFPMPSPYLGIVNQAIAQMTKLLQEFGMTPASRVRLPANEPGNPPQRKITKYDLDPREMLGVQN